MVDPSLIVEARRACTNPQEFPVSRRIWLLGRIITELEALQPNVAEHPALACLIITAKQILCVMEPHNDCHFVHVVRHLAVVLEVGELALRQRPPFARRLH